METSKRHRLPRKIKKRAKKSILKCWHSISHRKFVAKHIRIGYSELSNQWILQESRKLRRYSEIVYL